MIVVFQLSKLERAGSHADVAERHTSDSEWGSIKAGPVWVTLTDGETALASMAGMIDLESCRIDDKRRHRNSGILSNNDRSLMYSFPESGMGLS